ncbi:DUF3039 domain-containing protein [Paeniglutamicibacter antarcticus]|uniref:DUF3039 family protein n=1 Tax=Paeniglutamicibacter antarcticus TaxID=494023 RepID=A0ABP9TLF8_9MICC
MTTSTTSTTAPQSIDLNANGRGFNHFALKNQITESIVMGTPVTALCGATYVIQAQGGGTARGPKLAVCAMCKDLHENMIERNNAKS